MLTKLTSIAPLSCVLALLFFLGLAATIALPGFATTLALNACQRSPILLVASYAGYALVFGSVMHALLSALSVVLSGLVVEDQIYWKHLLLLWATSTIIGAVSFHALAENCAPFVGPVALAWAFAGLAATSIVRRWRSTSLVERLYLGWVALAVPGLLVDPVAIVVSELVAFSVGIGFGMVALKETRRTGVESSHAAT